MQSSSCNLKVKSIDIAIFCLYNWAAFLREIRKQQFISFFYLSYQYTVSYFSFMNHILVNFYILSFIQFRRSLLSCELTSQSLADIHNYIIVFADEKTEFWFILISFEKSLSIIKITKKSFYASFNTFISIRRLWDSIITWKLKIRMWRKWIF